MTVLGPIDPDRLGDVLMHEHLLHDQIDHPCWFQPEEGPEGCALADAPVSMPILGLLTRSPFGNRDNCRLARADPIEDEVRRFGAVGGGTIVEVTSRGLVPDPAGVRAISAATGVHVVMGCGWYVDHVLPDDLLDRAIDDLAAEIVADLRDGIEGGDVRAGIIGEVGTSVAITPREEASLRAAGRAAAETGASVMVHLAYLGHQAFEALRILTAEGAPADRVVMNHMDEADDLDYCRRVLELGCVIEFDTFGSEWYYDTWGLWEPRDTGRVDQLAALCAEGYGDRITLAHDVFYKQSLRAFGGLGYDHIHRSVLPMLERAGVGRDTLTAMLADTPRRLLTLPGDGSR
jgi:phosphotriesterase-related protein